MTWLLAIDTEGTRQYWTGRLGPNGGPQRTLWKCDAKHFRTAEIALAVTDTHRDLNNSEQWKVVKR